MGGDDPACLLNTSICQASKPLSSGIGNHPSGGQKKWHTLPYQKIWLGGNSLNFHHRAGYHIGIKSRQNNAFWICLSTKLIRNGSTSLYYLCHRDCKIAYLEVVPLRSGSSNLSSFRQAKILVTARCATFFVHRLAGESTWAPSGL